MDKVANVPAVTPAEQPPDCKAEQPVRFARQQQAGQAAIAVSDWNAVHAAVGSFADGHSIL